LFAFRLDLQSQRKYFAISTLYHTYTHYTYLVGYSVCCVCGVYALRQCNIKRSWTVFSAICTSYKVSGDEDWGCNDCIHFDDPNVLHKPVQTPYKNPYCSPANPVHLPLVRGEHLEIFYGET
jgi:hypothetical protein